MNSATGGISAVGFFLHEYPKGVNVRPPPQGRASFAFLQIGAVQVLSYEKKEKYHTTFFKQAAR